MALGRGARRLAAIEDGLTATNIAAFERRQQLLEPLLLLGFVGSHSRIDFFGLFVNSAIVFRQSLS